MNWKKLLLALVLADFVAVNILAMATGGLDGLIAFFAEGDLYTALVCFDLTIALSVAVAFIWKDAKARGVSPMPYAVLTVLTGSIGPLVYLLKRPSES